MTLQQKLETLDFDSTLVFTDTRTFTGYRVSRFSATKLAVTNILSGFTHYWTADVAAHCLDGMVVFA